MVDVRPFRALRAPKNLAQRVASLPYDVMDVDEARAMAGEDPYSFLRVSRPEIELAAGVDAHDDAVYELGRRNLDGFVTEGVLVRDDTPTYSVYRQRMGDVEQTGVVGVVAVADYDSGDVRTHEHTRPDKELDRVRHISALDAQDEPVFLLSPRSAAIETVVGEVVATAPVADFVSVDGVQHTVWVVDAPAYVTALTASFAAVPRLYVADGHHRSAAASRVAAERRASGARGEFDTFLAVVFPSDEVAVLAYNRVVDLAGRSSADLLARLSEDFVVVPSPDAVEPLQRHVFGLYAAGQWYELTLRAGVVDDADLLARLDVAVLQDVALAPLLGIGDPRTEPRLTFVGGIRGVAELERLVDADPSKVAFSLHPTSTEELLDVADAGLVMPPKSTWFEPKLRSGLFVHSLGPA